MKKRIPRTVMERLHSQRADLGLLMSDVRVAKMRAELAGAELSHAVLVEVVRLGGQPGDELTDDGELTRPPPPAPCPN